MTQMKINGVIEFKCNGSGVFRFWPNKTDTANVHILVDPPTPSEVRERAHVDTKVPNSTNSINDLSTRLMIRIVFMMLIIMMIMTIVIVMRLIVLILFNTRGVININSTINTDDNDKRQL